MLLGHVGENKIRAAAKSFGWTLTGTYGLCINCEKAKGRQKDTLAVSTVKVNAPGEHICSDISGPYAETPGHNRFALMALDKHTSRKWLFLLMSDASRKHTCCQRTPYLAESMQLPMQVLAHGTCWRKPGAQRTLRRIRCST